MLISIFVIIFSVLTLSSCSSDNFSEVTVLVLDGEGYFVDGENFRKVEKNGSVSFEITLEDNYEVVYWSEGSYKNGVLFLEDIKRSTTVEIYAKKIAAINYDKENLGVTIKSDISNMYLDSVINLEIDYLKENYHITELFINGEKLDYDTKDNKYYVEVILSQSQNDISYTERGDKVKDFYIYNNNQNYGEALVENNGDLRYGDNVKIVADSKNNGRFNYLCVNYKYYFQEEVSITIDSNSNFVIADFVSENAVPITIEANGGAFEDNLPEKLYFEANSFVNLNWFASGLRREGYSLSGLNTESDGSGQSHSVGALINLSDEPITFYAQWEKHSPNSYFTYTDSGNDTMTITGLSEQARHENIDKIVVPDYIEGKAVTIIGQSAFSDLNFVDTVSLSNTIKRVETGAFSNSSLSTLKFYDNTEYIAGDAISGCENFNKIVVNSNTPRVFTYVNWAYLAQKIMWYANCKEKTIVTLSGCNKVFGLDEDYLLKAFPYYTLAQIGMNGAGTDMYNLYELIKPYIKEGDIILLSPEYGYEAINSIYEKATFGGFMWEVYEANYDLLTYIDTSRYFGFFESYNAIAELKNTAYEGNILYVSSGAYDVKNHTKYGNTSFYRPNNEEDYFTSEGNLDRSCITEHSKEKFNEIYQEIVDLGAKAYYVFSPINRNCLPEDNLTEEYLEAFEQLIRDNYDIPLISKLDDHILDGKYFYDHNNHLTTEGATIDTQILASELQAQIAKDQE